jgi:hypothetical protein
LDFAPGLTWGGGPARGQNLTTTHSKKRNTEFGGKTLVQEALGELKRMQRAALLDRSYTDAQPKKTLRFRGREFRRKKMIVDN